jgi:hypothetical protein
MSLRKSPTLTPARIEANRRNARKSTGPRTARGKGQSRMNSLRTGIRSRFMHDLYVTLLDAPACAVDRVARTIITPEQAMHPLFADALDLFRETEIAVVLGQRRLLAEVEASKSMESRGSGRQPTGAECPTTPSECSLAPREREKSSSQNNERSLNVIENTV